MWQNAEVAKALRVGELEKPSNCSGCGRNEYDVFIEGHHPDYSKPLEVVWLCKECHLSEHRKIGSKAGRKKKIQSEKAKETMVVYLTGEQKESILKYCEKTNIPFSNLVKQMLVSKSIL